MAPGRSCDVLVVDMEGRDTLAAMTAPPGRVLCTFEASAGWRADVETRFPGVEIQQVVPHHEGPWHDVVDRDLASLWERDVLVDGVGLLECLRMPWRQELTALRALEFGIAGSRRILVTTGGPSERLIRGAVKHGRVDEIRILPSAEGNRRKSLLWRLRRAGPRGLALALSSRFDPSGDRRARLMRKPHLNPAKVVFVSSYANPTRSALEALDVCGGGPAILLCTGPGATANVRLPANVSALSIASALAADRRRARGLRSATIPKALTTLSEWDDAGKAWPRWTSLRETPLFSLLGSVFLPEVISTIVAVEHVLTATGAGTLVVGDEFAPGDRAAVHVARRMGRRTVSRQHGVIEGHYARERILSDHHLAWDDATLRWLRERDALGSSTVGVLPRRPPDNPRRAAERRTLVVFLQPTDLIRVPFDAWMAETLPPVLRAAEVTGLRVVLKPHPLQTAAQITDAIPAPLRGRARLVADKPTSLLLEDAAAAVLLDSSVCVDALDAGVPCLSTAWYRAAYVEDLVAAGYVEPCATPPALEEALVRRTRSDASR